MMKEKWFHRTTILAVDDKPENLQVIKSYLNDAGYSVIIASNGESAIKRAESKQPDLILLDVFMPGMSGFEVCSVLKERESTLAIPVLFVTASTDTQNIVKGFAAGAVDYISKPLKREELLARVATHLALSQSNIVLSKQVKQRTELIRLEKKRAEQLAERLKITLNAIGDAVISTDINGNVVQMNPVAESITGVNLSGAEGKKLENICSMVDVQTRAHKQMLVRDVLESREAEKKECYSIITTHAGFEIIVNENVSPIFDNRQTLIGAVWVFRDVTNEYNLRKQLTEKALMVESASIPIALSDLNKTITYANAAFVETWGYADAREMIGKKILDFWLIEDRIERIIASLMQGENVTEEAVAQRADGSRFNVLTSASVVFDGNGEPTGLMASSEDITEKKKAENRIKQSQKQLRTLIDAVRAIIIVINRDSKIIVANRAFAELVNKNIVEIIGTDFYSLFKNRAIADSIRAEDEIVFNTKNEYFETERSVQFADGTTKYFQTVKMYSNGDVFGEPAVLSFSTDITSLKNAQLNLIRANADLTETSERLKKANTELTAALAVAQKSKALELANEKLRKNEAELKKKQNDLEELYAKLREHQHKTHVLNIELSEKNSLLTAQKQKLETALHNLKQTQTQLIQSEKMASLGILTAGVAHEINNPLNYIHGGCIGLKTLLSDKQLGHDVDVAMLLSAIETGVDKAARIVKGLNQFSRNTDASNEFCDIHAIIDNCLEMLNNQLKSGIEVEKQYTAKSFRLQGNVGNMHQVFINIISNAIQSIEGEGKLLIKTCLLTSRFEIRIIDTGKGMTEETLSMITDPFFTTKAPGLGTGLGLSITFALVKKMKGQLKFKSEVGVGTEVIIRFPLHEGG